MKRLLTRPIMWLFALVVADLIYVGISEHSVWALIAGATFGYAGVTQARAILRGTEGSPRYSAAQERRWRRGLTILTVAVALLFTLWLLMARLGWPEPPLFGRSAVFLTVFVALLWMIETIRRWRGRALGNHG